MTVGLVGELPRRLAPFAHGLDLLIVPRTEREGRLTFDAMAHLLDEADGKRVAVELNDVMIADQRRNGQEPFPRPATRTNGALEFGELEQAHAGDMLP